MTFQAIQCRVSACQRKTGLAMIEIGRFPGRGVMANRTVLVEIIARVIGIVHIDVILFVARPAIKRDGGITVGVALNTDQCLMSAGQREIRLAVVENIGIPAAGVMAFRAVVGEAVLFMIGVIGAPVIILVARPAIGRRAGIPAGVTFQAVQ